MIEAFTSVDVGTTCEAHQPTNCELKTYAKTLRTAVSIMEWNKNNFLIWISQNISCGIVVTNGLFL